MSDRFDLEQQILDCWKVTDDLELVYEKVMNDEEPLGRDTIANLMLGLISLYNLKFDKCFTTFEKCVDKKEL